MRADADIIVIGAGITGCATAWHLARRGLAVTVLERGDIAALASAANAGSLHAQIPHGPFVEKGAAWAERFAPTVRFLAASVRVWQGLEAALGADLEVRVRGGLIVAARDRDMRDVERKARLEARHGLPIELLSAEELAARAPYLAKGLSGGAFCPVEGKANPLLAGPAFARAARRHGATIRRHAEVTGIARTRGGFTVHLASGERLACERLVNAAGADAARIAALAGVPMAAEGHPIQASVTEKAAPFIPHLVYSASARLTLKQTAAGSVLIGGGWPARLSPVTGFPIVDRANLEENVAVAVEAVPALERLRIVRTWAAIVNATEDWLPVLGEAPELPGYHTVFFPWMGFTAAPLAAEVVAAEIVGGAPPVDFDLSPFLASRQAA